MRMACLPLSLIMMSVLSGTVIARDPDPKRLQVFILAGQSNMVGHANYFTVPALYRDRREGDSGAAKLVFKEGSEGVQAIVHDQIALRIKRDRLNDDLRNNRIEGETAIEIARRDVESLTDGYNQKTTAIRNAFLISARVYITSIADNHRKSGPLTIGFGGSEDKIGPELGFGMSLARKVTSPILIIKTSWGGKSLHYDFRPPAAGEYELSDRERASDDAAEIREKAGSNYRMMIAEVHEVLRDLKAFHPGFDASAGYDLAGFVWLQGFNDQFSPEFRDNYEKNMVAFVKDVRHEFQTENLPFVIGVLGTAITEEEVGKNAVSLGQRAAAATPEFQGNVLAVETWKVYDLEALEIFKKGWQENLAEWSAIGSDRPYHYLGSGRFFVRLGDAFASAMAELIGKQ